MMRRHRHQAAKRHKASSLTPQGWIVLLCGVLLCTSVAFIIQPATLYLGLALLIAVSLASLLAPRRLRSIEGRWLIPSAIHAGNDVTLGCSLHDRQGCSPITIDAFNPGLQEIEAVCEVPGLLRAPTRLAWISRFPARGAIQLPPLQARNEQPFGLVRSSITIGEEERVLVLPAVGRLKQGIHARLQRWLEQGPATDIFGDDEISHLRDYRPGDSPHRIHWRASAHLRKFLVTQRHAPATRHVALILDTNLPTISNRKAHSKRFEQLVCAAATFIDHLFNHGWIVSLHGPAFGEDGIEGDCLGLLEQLAVVAPTEAEDLGPYLPQGALCVVLTDHSDRDDVPVDSSILTLPLSNMHHFVWMPRFLK